MTHICAAPGPEHSTWPLTGDLLSSYVYEHEPQIHPELLKLDNVVLSPHTGTGTWEGRIAMCENVCDNILAWEKGNVQKMDIVV